MGTARVIDADDVQGVHDLLGLLWADLRHMRRVARVVRRAINLLMASMVAIFISSTWAVWNLRHVSLPLAVGILLLTMLIVTLVNVGVIQRGLPRLDERLDFVVSVVEADIRPWIAERQEYADVVAAAEAILREAAEIRTHVGVTVVR